MCLSFDIWTFNNRFAPWKGSYDQPRQHIKKQRLYIINKGPSSQSYGFSGSHVWMWVELRRKLSAEELMLFFKILFYFYTLQNCISFAKYQNEFATGCFFTVVLGKTLESPLNYKEIQPVHSKGDQFWVFTGRTDAEAETPVLWPPHAKS